jgi:hypothetical protein
MSNGELHAREREDLALHVERCAERYTAVREEICGLRKQTRRIEGAIWGIVAVLVALGAGGRRFCRSSAPSRAPRAGDPPWTPPPSPGRWRSLRAAAPPCLSLPSLAASRA